MYAHCRSGRWRSEYRLDLDSRKVDGKILVNVHYYEQGNVRSHTRVHNWRLVCVNLVPL